MVAGMIERQADALKTQIKICGFTQPEDAVNAVAMGADTLGLVFYPPSSRHVSIAQAKKIAEAVGPLTSLTALFLDAQREDIEDVLANVPVSMLQFHGTESVEFCQNFNRPYIKSVPMKTIDDVEAYCHGYQNARGFLLDSNAAGAAGGSGSVFDWSRVPGSIASQLILAGGLSPDNVCDAVLQVQPAAVDVSSGVESAKGIKCAELIKEFIRAVTEADAKRVAG